MKLLKKTKVEIANNSLVSNSQVNRLPIELKNFVGFNCMYKKAQLTQGLRATAPSFQDSRQLQSWILSNR